MRYPRYKEYRNTGHILIGSIPSHWEVRKIKFLANIQNGRDYKHVESDDGFDVIGSGGAFVKASEYLYDGESVLFGRKGTIDVPLYINDRFWTVDTMFYSIILENTVAKFLYYCATVMSFKYLATQTALPSITQFDLENYFLTYPNKDEQQKIADFLDYKTQQIDQLIEKKKALIEKLNEQRIAFITQAVTKGLNKTAKMKPSGVDWLGDVPEHWKLKRLKFAVNLRNQKIEAKETDLSYLGMENIESFTARKIYDDQNPPQSDGVGSYFKIGDVLFGKLRPYLAKALHCDIEGFCSSELLVLEGIDIAPEFLVNLVLCDWFVELVNSSTYGAKMPRASWDFISNMICPIPEKSEQNEIVAYIDRTLVRLDNMVRVNKEAIDAYKEYRSSIITAAVTGKIDVREFELDKDFA